MKCAADQDICLANYEMLYNLPFKIDQYLYCILTKKKTSPPKINELRTTYASILMTTYTI